ncbi:MAG: hypothetical protein K6E67_03780 [Prevotella sp.]|nr:hypothetical protein [Prevotella sp.]
MLRAETLFPGWEHFIPKVGMFCSQGGNNKGQVLQNKCRVLKIKGTLFENKNWLFEKSLISPVNPSECLYLKVTWMLHLSLDLSHDFSHHHSRCLSSLADIFYKGEKMGIKLANN